MSNPSHNPISDALFERAVKVIPGGLTRFAVPKNPRPLYASHGEGAYLHDVDGHRYLDFTNNATSLIHGHAHSPTVEAVREQASRALAFSMANQPELLLAEELTARVHSFDKVSFCCSGTEAVMHAIKLARGVTRRPMIAKCEGAYHGLSDFAEMSIDSRPDNWGAKEPLSVPGSIGVPDAVRDAVLTVPFNDTGLTLQMLEARVDQLAAVLLDPLPMRAGLVPATPEYLKAIRSFCDRHGVVLIFDQVVSFRHAVGGIEEFLDCRADISTLGKMIGGGLPIGAVAGRADILNLFDSTIGKSPVMMGGTFAGNPISMAAGLAAVKHFTPDAVARINAIGERIRQELTGFIATERVNACVTGGGSLFRLHMGADRVHDYRSSTNPQSPPILKALLSDLQSHGFLVGSNGTGAISTPMTDSDIDGFLDATRQALRRLIASHPSLRNA